VLALRTLLSRGVQGHKVVELDPPDINFAQDFVAQWRAAGTVPPGTLFTGK